MPTGFDISVFDNQEMSKSCPYPGEEDSHAEYTDRTAVEGSVYYNVL